MEKLDAATLTMRTGLLDLEYTLLLRLDSRQSLGRPFDSRTYPGSHTSETCHCLWKFCTRLGPDIFAHYCFSMQSADAVESGPQQVPTGRKLLPTSVSTK